MALISNEGEPVSRAWVSKAISTIKTDREIFSSANMRRARLEFIAGKNRLTTIKGWLFAAQLIQNGRNSREQELTDFGLSILANDSRLQKSSTWWAFHLAACFSNVSEPYASLFLSLDTLSKDWLTSKDIFLKIKNTVKQENGEDYKESTLESLISSVRRMFQDDRPLADLGLIEIRKSNDEDKQICVRLGSPKLTDEIIAHALAMLKTHRFRSRSTVDFSEIIKAGLPNFLCCSPEELRLHLRRMNQTNNWKSCFSFTEAVNLDSISFGDACEPRKTVFELLNSGGDTWL